MIKICNEISFEDPDIATPKLLAMNLKICGFNVRLVNAYAQQILIAVKAKKMTSPACYGKLVLLKRTKN